MSFVANLLKRLEEERDEHAKASLSTPAGRDAFDYGRACGLYQGLVQAHRLLMDTISEAEDADDRL